jgi:type IV pilus assembly protein PilA
MITKMRDMMKRKNGQKGFTLVELIVVMAILAILAAIAIPRYSAVQNQAKINADAATAQSIISACEIYDANNNTTGAATLALNNSTGLMATPAAPQSGATAFVLSYVSASSKYKVTFGSYSYTEGDAKYTTP